LHQLAKQGLELGEESEELRREINRLSSEGDDVGIIGGRVFEGWPRGLSVKQRREVANVASVDVRSGHARSGRPWSGGGGAPSCLKTAVDITSFINRWVGPATKGARRRGSGIFGAHCRIMVTTTFDTDKWSDAIGFSMPVRLAPSALHERSFLPRRFDGNLHVA
jgi:hypothetical protein